MLPEDPVSLLSRGSFLEREKHSPLELLFLKSASRGDQREDRRRDGSYRTPCPGYLPLPLIAPGIPSNPPRRSTYEKYYRDNRPRPLAVSAFSSSLLPPPCPPGRSPPRRFSPPPSPPLARILVLRTLSRVMQDVTTDRSARRGAYFHQHPLIVLAALPPFGFSDALIRRPSGALSLSLISGNGRSEIPINPCTNNVTSRARARLSCSNQMRAVIVALDVHAVLLRGPPFFFFFPRDRVIIENRFRHHSRKFSTRPLFPPVCLNRSGRGRSPPSATLLTV